MRLIVGQGQVHCYPLLPDFIPEGKRAMKEIAAFVRVQLNRQAQPAL